MIQTRDADGYADPAELVTTGPDAGCVRYGNGTTRDVTAVRIIGGDPADLRKAAAILRAKGFWLGPETSMRCRREADRLDDLAKGARP
jgi:hypothetical protein